MDPFVAQIMLVPFNFAPKGWAFCNGQLLPISQNTALFSLLGTQYGGDGRSTFALPNLQGNVAIHMGNGPLGNFAMGETSGTTSVTLLQPELPAHTHTLEAAQGTATGSSPSGLAFAPGGGRNTQVPYYVAPPANAAMNASALQLTGGNQPHNNMMPYLTMYYIIALQGIYPSRQ